VYQRLGGEGNEDQARELAALVPWLVALGRLPDRFGAKVPTAELRGELNSLIENPRREGSVRELLSRVYYNASAVRDRLSDDTWRLFNNIERRVQPRGSKLRVPEALELLNSLVLSLSAFSGLEMENMTRGHGWRFLDLGRRLERAQKLVALVKAAIHPSPRNDAMLGPLLEVCDSAMTYRRCYHARPQFAPLLDLLLADETNPRSLTWQLQRLSRHAAKLPRDGREGSDLGEKVQVDALLSQLASVNFERFTDVGANTPEPVVRLCDEQTAGLDTLAETIAQHYFAHALPTVR
jgi:uncharacterized alpha-E superfamily protein